MGGPVDRLLVAGGGRVGVAEPTVPTPAPPPKDSDDMDRQAVLDDAGLLEDD